MVGSGGGSGVPTGRACVGRQSTFFSPISDWILIVQVASARKSWNPGLSIFSVTAALASRRGNHFADRAGLDAVDQ